MISILLPTLDEVENVEPLLGEIEAAMHRLDQPYEVIFIDDGSTDGTRDRVEGLARGRPHVRAILFRRNAGQTAAFDAGFRHASGEIIVTLDSDGQNDPADIPSMFEKLEEGYDFVAGWRRDRKDAWISRRLPSRVANGLVRILTGTQFRDLGCSLKLYRREVVNDLRPYGEMHRLLGVLAEGVGARVCEVPVNHRARTAGSSKYNLSRTFKVILDLITVWFMQGYRTKPSYVFGGLGLGFGTVGLILAGVTLWEKYSLDTWVHKNPLFIVAIFLCLTGLLMVGLGLIAELITRTHFESTGQVPYYIRRITGFDDEPVEPD